MNQNRMYFLEVNGQICAKVNHLNDKLIKKLKKQGILVHPVYS